MKLFYLAFFIPNKKILYFSLVIKNLLYGNLGIYLIYNSYA